MKHRSSNSTRSIRLVVVVVLLWGAQACSAIGQTAPPPTATVDMAAVQATATKKAEVEHVFGTLVAMTTATAQQAMTATAEAGTSVPRTATAVAARTLNAQHLSERRTATAEAQAVATQQVAGEATAQAGEFFQMIQKLAERGYLSTSEGIYLRLDDYTSSLANPGMYEWANSGESATEFVLRADMAWDSASKKADWAQSGCGFVFSENGVKNHFAVFLELSGYVSIGRVKNDKMRPIGRDRYGDLEKPQGNAELILIVENEHITVLVNQKKVLRVENSGYSEGDLGLAVLSGTDKSFGTRCSMSQIDLWKIVWEKDQDPGINGEDLTVYKLPGHLR